MTKQSGATAQTGRSRVAGRRRRAPLLQRLRRRDLILLTGLFALACTSLITVGLLILRFQTARNSPAAASVKETAEPAAVHTIGYLEVTGLSQYQPAEQEARQWAEDAQLTAAFANWPGVTGLDQIGAPGRWTYRFYSASKERLLIVKVEADKTIQRIEHVVQITLPPPVLGTDDWLIDSPAALGRWLDYGGAELVRRNPGLEVLIQLRSLNNYPSPVWMVVGTDARTRDILVVVIDAHEGRVVPVNPGQ